MTSPTSTTSRYLLALGVATGTVLFLLLGIGALGIVGDGDRDAVYLAAPVVGLLVAAATRFRPAGMALALGAAAVATLLAGAWSVVVVATDRADASVVDVVMLSGMYAVLFAFAGWLFSRVPTGPSRGPPPEGRGAEPEGRQREERHDQHVAPDRGLVGARDELLHRVDGVRQRQDVADRLEHGGHRRRAARRARTAGSAGARRPA